MSYSAYRNWLRTLSNEELDKEIQDNQTRKLTAQSQQACEAWGRMLQATLVEQGYRRTDELRPVP